MENSTERGIAHRLIAPVSPDDRLERSLSQLRKPHEERFWGAPAESSRTISVTVE
jgi:hypothetical protein